MAWSLQAGAVTNASAFSWNIDYPADIQAGDLLYLALETDTTHAATPDDAGFTSIVFNTLSGGAFGLWEKVADGTETGQVNVDWAGQTETGIGFIFRVRNDAGALATTDRENLTSSNVNNASHTITPSDDGALVIAFAYQDPAGTPNVTWNSPAVELAEGVRNNNALLSVAYYEQATAASVTLTRDQGSIGATTFNLLPPAGGGGSPQTVTPSALASAGALGAATAQPGGIAAGVSGISSASALGAATASPGAVAVGAGSIATAQAFGAPTIVPGGTVIPIGALASASALGAASAGSGTTVEVTSLASASVFGAVTPVPGGTEVATPALSSAATFGTPSVSGGEPVSFLPSVHGGRYRR